MNAFSSAFEPLRIANQLSGKELFHWRCVSEDGKPVRCSNGIPLGVDGDLEGIGADGIVLVCSGVLPKSTASRKVADRIRRLWRQGQTVGGICTGSYTLARAGILKGRAFTLHWENILAFQELYPDLDPAEQRFSLHDRIWTCAGGLAATDMIVSHIRDRCGQDLAISVANMCLHSFPRRETEPQKAGTAATIGVRNAKLVNIIEHFNIMLEDELNLDDVAARYQMSRRQMERLFNRYLGTTPKKFLMNLRLEKSQVDVVGDKYQRV